MMNGTLPLKVMANDSPHTLGALMLRLLPEAETQQRSFLMSVLRAMQVRSLSGCFCLLNGCVCLLNGCLFLLIGC